MSRWGWIAALVTLAAILATPARAQPQGKGYYVSITPSFVAIEDSDLGGGADLSTDAGVGILGAVGYRYSANFRAEIELGFRRADFDEISAGGTFFGTSLSAGQSIDGDISALSSMLNGYYDVPTQSRFTPYVGGGIGFSLVDVESGALATDEAEAVFAFQAMVGTGYRISKNVSARAGYRFFATTDPEFNGTEVEFRTHNIEVGLVIGLAAF